MARILADLAEAETEVRQPQAVPQGILKLSLPDAYGRIRVLPVLEAYMRRWPAVRVEATFSDRIDPVVEDGLDLAIRIGSVDASAGLVTRVVDRFQVVCCASPDYLSARGDSDGDDLLLFGRHGRAMSWLGPDSPQALHNSRTRPRMILDSAEALRSAALAGLGAAHLPDFLVASDLEAGTLSSISEAAEMLTVRALYPDRRLLPARVRLFIDMLVENLG